MSPTEVTQKRNLLIAQLLKLDNDLSAFLDQYSRLLEEKDKLLDKMTQYTLSPTQNN
jgi:hypothetical protein